ncbi:hypothetical protein OHAE_2917 [Ochrobactrum soli]|uniref:Uncharacterized protein n=1 Tax=Ochrobactrum soli TaxID=2448455 RepID=A0A2P9HFV6_9HYPH|nr:hypothetical protein OHAE_2917 [[Ochrobactrum] soli]
MHDRTFSGRFRLNVHDCSPMAFPKMAFAKLNERLTLACQSVRFMKADTPGHSQFWYGNQCFR